MPCMFAHFNKFLLLFRSFLAKHLEMRGDLRHLQITAYISLWLHGRPIGFLQTTSINSLCAGLHLIIYAKYV